MKQRDFEKKYGLEGKARPSGISKKTREIIKALHRKSDRAIEAGEDYTKTETRKFG